MSTLTGKFNSRMDEVVYNASLDQSFLDGELGSVDGPYGWHGLLLDYRGKAYIVHEDNSGFVDVERFATPEAAYESWFEILELENAATNNDDEGWV